MINRISVCCFFKGRPANKRVFYHIGGQYCSTALVLALELHSKGTRVGSLHPSAPGLRQVDTISPTASRCRISIREPGRYASACPSAQAGRCTGRSTAGRRLILIRHPVRCSTSIRRIAAQRVACGSVRGAPCAEPASAHGVAALSGKARGSCTERRNGAPV